MKKTIISSILLVMLIMRCARAGKKTNSIPAPVDKESQPSTKTLKDYKPSVYLAKFSLMNPEGEEISSQLGRYWFTKLENQMYKFEFQEDNHLASEGHQIFVPLHSAELLNENGLKNNTVYEMVYYGLKGKKQLKKTKKKLKARLRFSKILNSQKQLYEGLRFALVTSPAPVLPAGYALSIELINDVQPKFTILRFFFVTLFLIGSTYLYFAGLFGIKNIYEIKDKHFWFFYFIINLPLLINPYFRQILGISWVNPLFYSIFFAIRMAWILILSSRSNRGVLSAIMKVNFFYVAEAYNWFDKLCLLLSFVFVVLAATIYPEYHIYSYHLLPVMWMIDFRRFDQAQPPFLMMIRTAVNLLYFGAQYYLPFCWLQMLDNVFSESKLAAVDSCGLIWFTLVGCFVNLAAYYLFFVRRLGERRATMINKFVLIYKVLHGKTRGNGSLILKGHLGKYRLNRDQHHDSSLVSLNLQVPIFLPGWRNCLIEAETRWNPLSGQLDKTGWIAGMKNSKGKVRFRSSRLNEHYYQRINSNNWAGVKKQVDWQFRLFDRIRNLDPENGDFDLRIMPLSNQINSLTRPLLIGFSTRKKPSLSLG